MSIFKDPNEFLIMHVYVLSSVLLKSAIKSVLSQLFHCKVLARSLLEALMIGISSLMVAHSQRRTKQDFQDVVQNKTERTITIHFPLTQLFDQKQWGTYK